MRTPADNYIIRFPKEQKIGSIILPTALGTEAGDFAPEVGEVFGLPMKFTNRQHIPCSDFGRKMTTNDIAKYCKDIRNHDRVFCHYLASDENRKLPINDEIYNYFTVPAHLIIAVLDCEVMIPVAGNVIILPLEKELSKVILCEKEKDYNLGTIAFNGPELPWLKGDRVIYRERLSYQIKYENMQYDVVYFPEVYAKLND